MTTITAQDRARAEAILACLRRDARLAGPRCEAPGCPLCFGLHGERIARAVCERRPLELVLPAFPAKSPSPRKVLGALPDRAEELALSFLASLVGDLEALQPPGVRLIVCSDGKVFGDLVAVDDATIGAYGRALRASAARVGARRIAFFDLDDAMPGLGGDAQRAALVERFAAPLASIERAVRTDEAERALFCGLHRFLFEDALGTAAPGESRAQLRKRTKARAYRVLRRSHAWSALVAARFPDAVRLSIHPQPAHAEKLGIRLVPCADAWLTPWHGVAIESPSGQSYLLRREHAEDLGAVCVRVGGRPSHYAMAADGRRAA